MEQRRENLNNQGSAIIEVTLIISVILMIMVLFITILLGVLRQAEVHATLMTEYEKLQGSNTKGDCLIYSEQTKITLVQGYEVSSVEQQVVRISKVEDNLRRWQIFGDMVSE